MDFARVEGEFGRLKVQFERGDLTEAEFKAQLEELMIEDEQGRWWILGYETGQWYVHDGEKWVQQEPPKAAPGAAPTHPQHPGAADLTPDSQPGSTTAAPSRPAVGLRLGRDGMSILLITAGWLVCFGGNGWWLTHGGSVDQLFFVFAITGAIGGLITSLVLRWTAPPSPWKQVPVVAIGWAIGWALAGAILAGSIIDGAIAGLVGGLITGLALRWTQPSIHWKHVAIMTLGWGIGWTVGGALGPDATRDWRVSLTIGHALWGAIGGAVGSWVTFWQLREAAQSAA